MYHAFLPAAEDWSARLRREFGNDEGAQLAVLALSRCALHILMQSVERGELPLADAREFFEQLGFRLIATCLDEEV
jgi:hypothetical protein